MAAPAISAAGAVSWTGLGARLKDGGVFPTEQPGVAILLANVPVGGVHGGHETAAEFAPAGRVGPHLQDSDRTLGCRFLNNRTGSRLFGRKPQTPSPAITQA